MKKYDVAAYIWPSYTGDELRNRMFWPEGMGEWTENSVLLPDNLYGYGFLDAVKRVFVKEN